MALSLDEILAAADKLSEEEQQELFRALVKSLLGSQPVMRSEGSVRAGELGRSGVADYLSATEVTLESSISGLYAELKDLVGRSRDNPVIGAEIERKTKQLRKLQQAQAEIMRQRAEARRHLPSGVAHRALAEAQQMLDSISSSS